MKFKLKMKKNSNKLRTNNRMKKKLNFQMKMIDSTYRTTVACIVICITLSYPVTATEHHLSGSETEKTSNHDDFVTIDNMLMDDDDQISTNSKNVIRSNNEWKLKIFSPSPRSVSNSLLCQRSGMCGESKGTA